MVPLTITSSNPIGTSLFPFLLVSKFSFQREAQTFPGHFGFLTSLSQQAKEGIKLLGGVIDPNYQG